MGEGDTPTKKRKRIDFSEDVTVVVGPGSNKSFTVPHAVLTKTSEFFKACCSSTSQWQEGVTKTVKLPETDTDTFQTYLQWLWTGELVVSDEYDLGDGDDDMKGTVNKIYCSQLQKLAVFADTYQDDALSNTVADWLLKTSEDLYRLPIVDTIRSVWTTLPKSSLIRKLILDIWHTYTSKKIVAEMSEGDFPWEFVYDLMISYREEANGEKEEPDPSWHKRCNYHIHNDKLPKCTRRR